VARITIEDCLKTGYNKFILVHLALKRVIQFKKGKGPLIDTSNKEIVTALREIAAGKIKMKRGDDLLRTEVTYELKNPSEDIVEIADDVDTSEINQEK